VSEAITVPAVLEVAEAEGVTVLETEAEREVVTDRNEEGVLEGADD